MNINIDPVGEMVAPTRREQSGWRSFATLDAHARVGDLIVERPKMGLQRAGVEVGERGLGRWRRDRHRGVGLEGRGGVERPKMGL